MGLRIRNTWKYKGEDWWDWSAFIEDDGSGELSKVLEVEYILHPTFHDPIRKIKDVNTKFRMETEGWGTFMLKAIVHYKDGRQQTLAHHIMLEYDPAIGNSK